MCVCDVQGSVRINPKNYEDAYVPHPVSIRAWDFHSHSNKTKIQHSFHFLIGLTCSNHKNQEPAHQKQETAMYDHH